MENINSSPNPLISKFNANTVLTKLINGSVNLERIGQRIHLTEIQNLQSSKSPLPTSSKIMEETFEGFQDAIKGPTGRSCSRNNGLEEFDKHEKCVIHRNCISKSSLSYAPDNFETGQRLLTHGCRNRGRSQARWSRSFGRNEEAMRPEKLSSSTLDGTRPQRNPQEHDHVSNGTPFKLTPSPQSYKMKITPLSRNRRLQEVIYEKQQCTPQSTTGFYNPFELCTEILQLPTVSPHLFKEVVSPSDQEDEKFSWTIDQLAVLRPTNIETSPFNQVDLPSDPEYERKAQEAIDRYFSAPTVVPSPWTNSSHSINIMSGLLSSGSSSQLCLSTAASPYLMPPINTLKGEEKLDENIVAASKVSTREVWSQTELSLPPTLPEEIEKTLKTFCTFHQDQTQQEEAEDVANLNNTTLRRKLLFSNEELANITPLCSPKNDSEGFVGEIKNCSPVVSEPLPYEEDETVHPWGVSVIHPSSRLSRSQSPSSMSFIRYSLGGDEELCSSPFQRDRSQDVSVKMEGISNCSRTREASPVSLRGFSPIICIPSADSNTTQFSSYKNSFGMERTSPRTTQNSLKPLAVITDKPTLHHHIPYKSSQLLSPVIDVAHSHCNSFNSSLLQIHCTSADSSMTKPSDDDVGCCGGNKLSIADKLDGLGSCIKDKKRAQMSESQLSKRLFRSSGSKNRSSAEYQDSFKDDLFSSGNTDDKNTERITSIKNSEKVLHRESANQSHRTPPTKAISMSSYTKSSPQFSSSPIKSANFNSSLNYLSESISEGERSRLKSSPRFSESPPVSPIAWKIDDAADDFPGSSIYKYDQYLVVMGDLNDESNLESNNSNDEVRPTSNSIYEKEILKRNSKASDEISENFTARQLMLMQTSSEMDVDSQPFLEGSAIDEATYGQDTGYHTGMSTLQSTNYSLQTTQFTENKNLFDAERKLIEGNSLGSSSEEIDILSTS